MERSIQTQMRLLRWMTAACLLAMRADADDVVTAGPKLRATEGTEVRLRFEDALSSATSHAGDRIKFEVAGDVKSGNSVVISKGSRAWGAVTEASPRGRLDRNGKLNVHVDAVCLVDGKSAPLRAVANPGAAALGGQTAGQSFAEGVMAFPAAPILLFVYGKRRHHRQRQGSHCVSEPRRVRSSAGKEGTCSLR